MNQFHGRGTLVVAHYTSKGIVVASDSLLRTGGVDGIILSRAEVRKLFRVDKRTVCALGDLSGCTGPDEKWIDFCKTVEKGALLASELRKSLLFEDKCELVASGLNDLLQELPDVVARYPEKTVSTLLFFGYQGRGARFGFCEFIHEIENNKVASIRGDQIVTGSELWVFGPSKTIEARMGADFQKVGRALLYSVRDSSLEDAANLVDSLISASIEEAPEILGGRVQVAKIPRNPKMEPTFSGCR